MILSLRVTFMLISNLLCVPLHFASISRFDRPLLSSSLYDIRLFSEIASRRASDVNAKTSTIFSVGVAG
jgi:hypothetical protein